MSSPAPTAWAVICGFHGRVFLTEQEYDAQMDNPDLPWRCTQLCTEEPIGPCGAVSEWDDAHYEEWQDDIAASDAALEADLEADSKGGAR